MKILILILTIISTFSQATPYQKDEPLTENDRLRAIVNDNNNSQDHIPDHMKAQQEENLEEEENPACAMVICLSTQNLDNSMACILAQTEFQKIKKKTLGIVDLPKTIIKRTKKLESCEGSRKSDTAAIMAMYGTLM